MKLSDKHKEHCFISSTILHTVLGHIVDLRNEVRKAEPYDIETYMYLDKTAESLMDAIQYFDIAADRIVNGDEDEEPK